MQALGWGFLASLFEFSFGVQGLLRCLFKLSKVHLGTIWVLFENAFIGLLPLIQNVEEPLIGFRLCAVNEIPNLKSLLPQLGNTLVVLFENFRFA